MASVLLCAEFGVGATSLSRLADCAVELTAQGHAIQLLCRDLKLAHSTSEFEKVSIFPVPFQDQESIPSQSAVKDATKQRGCAVTPKNYSSVLLQSGYADSATLAPILRSWLHFIATFNTDLVIADSSPTALLAANLLNVPAVMLGEGYAVPPPTQPLSNVTPWRESSEGLQMLDSHGFFEDQEVLTAVNGAIKNLGFVHSEFEQARDLFADATQWVVSLPEMDHYGQRDIPYMIRWRAEDSGLNPVWPPGPGEKIFVYMDADSAHLTELLIQLTAIGDPVLAVIPDASNEFIRQYKADNLHIQREQVNMQAVLKQCDTIINHGGHDLVYELLLLGIPCILLPNCHENTLLSYRLAKQKLSFAGPAVPKKLNVVGLLKAAHARGIEWQNAADLARRYKDNEGLTRLHDLISAKFAKH